MVEVRPDGLDGPCSDITLNMRDMRSKFGYATLYEIARISGRKIEKAVCPFQNEVF